MVVAIFLTSSVCTPVFWDKGIRCVHGILEPTAARFILDSAVIKVPVTRPSVYIVCVSNIRQKTKSSQYDEYTNYA